MPQKRNPGLINDCRRDAGLVIGEAQGVMLRIQNLQLGMADVRDAQVLEALADDACITLRTFAGIVRLSSTESVHWLNSMQIGPARKSLLTDLSAAASILEMLIILPVIS